ncbi:MAG: hypothetical protein ACK4E7_16355 [Permianibacter sp.]
MKTNLAGKTSLTLTAAAVALLCSLSVTDAQAADRGQRVNNQVSKQVQVQRQHRALRAGGDLQQSTTVTFPDGRQATRELNRTVDRDNHSFSSEISGTTRNGVEYSRTATGSRDPETGRFERQISSSNSLGQSASTTITGQRSENGMVRDRTTTLGDGRTASAHTEVVRQDGVRTVTTTGSNFDGEAFSRTATTTRTENGLVRDVAVSGPNGERSRHDEVVRDPATGTVSRTSSGINANGEWSASAVTTRTDNGYVREASRTNANGQTITQSGELVRNDDGSWVRTQTTTGPNGGSRTVTVNGSIDAETGAREREVIVERTPPASGEPTP